MATTEITKIQLPDGNEVTFCDSVARTAASIGIEIVKVTTLPTASASTKGKIYLISNSGAGQNIYDEYVTVETVTDGVSYYAWEKIGTTETDLSGYVSFDDVDSELSSTSQNPVQNKVITASLEEKVSTKVNGVVKRSTDYINPSKWAKIAECIVPNTTTQIQERFTITYGTVDTSNKYVAEILVNFKGNFDVKSAFITNKTTTFNIDNLFIGFALNYDGTDKNILEIWYKNIYGWDSICSTRIYNYSKEDRKLNYLTTDDAFQSDIPDYLTSIPIVDISGVHDVDSSLNSESDNPVANSVVTAVNSQAVENAVTLGYSAKNLLNTELGTVPSGINASINNGIITFDGTMSAWNDWNIGKIAVTDGIYKISGCQEGGNLSSYSLDLRKDGATVSGSSDTGNGAIVNLSAGTYVANIRLARGVSFENVVFEPMIRDARITDDTYVPYKPSVEERLTALESAIADLGS